MKMETPKMDVVRFEEADVIAASGGQPQPILADSIEMGNLNNGKPNDVTLDGVPVDTYEKLAAKLGGSSNSYFQYQSNTIVHESEIFNYEDTNVLADGTYTRNGSYWTQAHGTGTFWQLQ